MSSPTSVGMCILASYYPEMRTIAHSMIKEDNNL